MVGVPASRVALIYRTSPLLIATALLTTAFLGILAPSAAAAPLGPYFGPNVLVNQPPAYSAWGTASLAVGSDGVAIVAFVGWGGPTTQNDIFFSKSDDGRTWEVPVKVNNDIAGASQQEPALALDSANNIVIAWADNRNGPTNYDLFFAKSTDGGQSFSSNLRVNDVTTNSQTDPAVAVDHANPDLIHVVWTDRRSAVTNADIFYANSTDGGLSFNPSIRVNNDSGAVDQVLPALAVAPNRDVYAVWTDPRTPARGRDIYFAKSTDRGATWTTNANPVNDDPVANVAQEEPAMAVNETGTIFVAWTDYRSGTTAPDIWSARSTNTGSTFTTNAQVNDDDTATAQFGPSLAARAGTVEIAWTDSRTAGSTNWDVYASSSPDGVTWSENARVNDDGMNTLQVFPSVGIDGQRDVFVAWLDTRGTGSEMYASVLDRVAPAAVAGPPVTIDQGDSVAFDAGGSTDNLGIASSSWDFGDGGSGNGSTVAHVYPEAGVFTATLTVWDASGNSATASRVITVRDAVAPVARGNGDRAVEEGQPLFFDASASTDNVGVTSYLWEFGDGSTATTATATHVYGRSGAYTARLTVTDAAGNAATSTFTITVRPNADLGLIQLLGGLLGALAVVIGLLGWMLLGMRKNVRERGVPGPMPHNPGDTLPPPPREADPLDMTFPPAQPPETR